MFISVLRPVMQTTDNRVTEYDTNCALPASDLNELVLAIFTSVLPQVSSQDNDQEVRECSISVLGSLLAHFGDILLKDSGRSNDTFSLLLKRVDNETTRIPAMRTLIKVARSTISSPFASCSDIIVNTMYGTVSKLLGQQDRTLRQTALRSHLYNKYFLLKCHNYMSCHATGSWMLSSAYHLRVLLIASLDVFILT